MKPGDLVQSTIFDPTGSGGYGLVMGSCDTAEHWSVWWVGDTTPVSKVVEDYPHGAIIDIHEDDIVVVSAGIEKENKE
tara:strand:- start:10509 stop:10742 length:234 start_codon:yes stop_codon:yes gene_type:complete